MPDVVTADEQTNLTTCLADWSLAAFCYYSYNAEKTCAGPRLRQLDALLLICTCPGIRVAHSFKELVLFSPPTMGGYWLMAPAFAVLYLALQGVGG